MASKRRSGSRLLGKDYRLAVYLRDKCRCMYCGRPVVPGVHVSQSNAATLDHVVPVAAGGSNSYQNLVTVCAHCNSSRQDKSPRQWFAVLRDRGIDTGTLSARVSRATSKDLAPYLARAREIQSRERQARAVQAVAVVLVALLTGALL